MIRLQEQVRALWADQLHPEDVIRIYTVRPTPAPEPGGQPRLHLIVEGNRPDQSSLPSPIGGNVSLLFICIYIFFFFFNHICQP